MRPPIYRHKICLCWLLLLTLNVSNQVFSQRFPFGRAAKSNNEASQLTDKAGPWLIMVASFSGEGGETQAKRLANELQSRYKLQTYIHAQQFNFDLESKAVGYRVVEVEANERMVVPNTLSPANAANFEEFAVLVGDFPSIEDPRAQRALEMIKKLQPESMARINVEEGFNGEELAGARLQAWRVWSDMQEGREVRPLRAAFLMANPLLPEEYFAARRVDKGILDLNSGLKYSLLKCPGDYSVRVASFSGSSTMVPKEMEKIRYDEQRKRATGDSLTESKLVDAAKKATLLTLYLRREGYEAYEFHDRHESYVCVGSFDWATREDNYGRQVINPEIEKTIAIFKGKGVSSRSEGKNAATLSGETFPLPKKFFEAGIACDVQPLPVLIPKSENSRFASKLLERFR